METQEPTIEATPEALSKLETRSQEIKDELAAMEQRKIELGKELKQIDSSITDTRYAVDLVANPEKLANEVAIWVHEVEEYLNSINLESVKEYPNLVVDLFGSNSQYWQYGQNLLKKVKKFNNPDLEEQILSTFKKIKEKAHEVRNDPEYTKLIEDVSWPR